MKPVFKSKVIGLVEAKFSTYRYSTEPRSTNKANLYDFDINAGIIKNSYLFSGGVQGSTVIKGATHDRIEFGRSIVPVITFGFVDSKEVRYATKISAGRSISSNSYDLNRLLLISTHYYFNLTTKWEQIKLGPSLEFLHSESDEVKDTVYKATMSFIWSIDE